MLFGLRSPYWRNPIPDPDNTGVGSVEKVAFILKKVAATSSFVAAFFGGKYMENRDSKLKILIISAIMIAVGTVLSELKITMPMGGGLTICAMLPLVLISYRYNTLWGVFTAFVFSILQCILGFDNIQYASSTSMALVIVLFDYIIAYTVIGFSGIFKNTVKNRNKSLIMGIAVTFSIRFLCHFFTGWVIWDALWPNEFGMVAPLYSFCYNIIYMIPEMIITAFVGVKFMEKYYDKIFL